METPRDAFFGGLYQQAKENADIILLVADCGAPAIDQWRDNLPDQYINVGIAEQVMLNVALGLALAGKRPYCYAIAPFASLRCLEQIKMICLHNLPVVIVGVGAGLGYNEAGPTHHALEDVSALRGLPNLKITSSWGSRKALWQSAYYSYNWDSPTYVRLNRHNDSVGEKIVIVSGKYEQSWYPEYLKPLDIPDYFRGDLGNELYAAELVVTVEEQFTGGLGSILAEYMKDHDIKTPLRRVYMDKYEYKYGNREDIWDGEAKLQQVIEEFRAGNK